MTYELTDRDEWVSEVHEARRALKRAEYRMTKEPTDESAKKAWEAQQNLESLLNAPPL